MHPAEPPKGDQQEEEGACEGISQNRQQPRAHPLKEGLHQPLPHGVKAKEEECEQDDVELLPREKRHLQPPPKEGEQEGEVEEV